MNALPSVREFSLATAGEIMENLLIKGDLGRLTGEERARYYTMICSSIGLNPMTKPFEYIVLNGKLTLYALKACTDQLRQIKGVSIAILSREIEDGLLTVHVKAKDAQGREDEDLGVVYLPDHVKGEPRANLILKAITKAKRRVTLSICGLGMLDETEMEDIPAAAKREAQEPVAPEALPSVDTAAPAEIQGEAVAAPKKPGRKRKDPNSEIDKRFEAVIHNDQHRRAFDRPTPPDPEAEIAAWDCERKAEEFIAMEHEIQSVPSLAALDEWFFNNRERVAQFSEGEMKNGLRKAYADKRMSLQPHSISQRAIYSRGPRYAHQQPLPI